MEKENDIPSGNTEEHEKKSLLDRLRSMLNSEDTDPVDRPGLAESAESIGNPETPENPDSSPKTDDADPKDSEIERLRRELAEARAAVEQARAEGEKAGRNARIEELLSREPSDVLPAPSASASPRTALDSIFALAAGAR